MALIPVRSKQPIDGETFITEVGAEHLERWPDDYEPLEGEDLVRYELQKAGVADEHLAEAIEAASVRLAEVQQATAGVAASQPTEDDSDLTPPSSGEPVPTV